MANTPIYTIGYGARTVEELLVVLKQHGIAFLVDVRSQPYSSIKPEFSKAPLETRVHQEGIRYVFMGDTLGGRPSDTTLYINGKVDYELVRTKPFYLEGIARLRSALDQGLCLALMCSEGKPQECHRSKLIGYTLDAEGIEVLHIDEIGAIKTQQDVVNDLTHGQQSMFGLPPVVSTSRKKYTEG
ncbi:MAG: DUF488 family protein [Chloroflexia bacterium]